MTPTLPLELVSPRRYAAAPATSPTIRSSGMGIAPDARAAAIASSGAAPGASRWYRFGITALRPPAAKARVNSAVCRS
jgi:hypothetical protein